jgi:hypothetical protein
MNKIRQYWKAIGAAIGPPLAVGVLALLDQLNLNERTLTAAAIAGLTAAVTTALAPKNEEPTP